MTEITTPSGEQKDIINADGNTIVIANPGTGKTTTLAFRVIRLLEQGTDPEDILCITFTRKARREMYERVMELGKDKFSEQVKKVNIQTFHSFAYNYMTDRGVITGKTAEENALRFSMFTSMMENHALNYDKEYIIDEFVPKTASAVTYVKSFGITPDMIDIRRTSEKLERAYNDAKKSGRSTTYTIEEVKGFLQYFVDAYGAYEDSKGNSSDYTDILLQFRKNFARQRLFGHALIDEMQDMNEIQAGIAKDLAETTFLVGDPKQAIFGFQGGSTRYLKSFMELKFSVKHLAENRRSTSEILEYARQHYLANTDPNDDVKRSLENLRSDKSGDKPTVISTAAPLSSILDVIRKNPGTQIGILARSNAQVLQISNMLDENGILHTSATTKSTTEAAKRHIMDFLSGLLKDDAEYKVRAAFTAFSPYTLKEAFEISEDYIRSGRSKNGHDMSFEKLDALCGDTMTVRDMDSLFDTVILPICIARGAEWFFTARAIKLEIDEYLSTGIPTSSGFFDYLAVCVEPGVEEYGAGPDSRDEKPLITLSTVHKAKGREFEMVIYWPRDVDKFDFMDIIKASVLKSCDTDVSGELGEEQSRLHFVALTRAKKKLYIIASEKAITSFAIKKAANIIVDDTVDEEDAVAAPVPSAMARSQRLEEAYALFVNNKTAESKKRLEETEGEKWMEDAIFKYFGDLEKISYSNMKKKASEYLQRNIIEIPRAGGSKSAEFGSSVHDAMQQILEGGLAGMDKAAQEYSAKYRATQPAEAGGSGHAISMTDTIRNGCDAISEIKKGYANIEVDSVEKKLDIPLSAMTEHEGAKDMKFVGKIDVILKHDSGYVIIDYKTDKKRDGSRLSGHNKQLAAYKRMLAHKYEIPESSIDTYVVFVAIRGTINTGRLDYEHVKSKRDAYAGFEKMLVQTLEWKQDPAGFIRQVLDEGQVHNEDALYDAIRRRLKSGQDTGA